LVPYLKVSLPKNENSVIIYMLASWYFCEHALTDTEEKKLLNNVIVFVFFVHKKYSCSFINVRLNRLCHIDYLNNVLTTFLGLELVSCVVVYAGSESSQI